MAAKKSKTTTQIVRAAPSHGRPQSITINTPRPIVHQGGKGKTGKSGKNRRHHHGGDGSLMTVVGYPAAAGLVLGWVDKNQPNFPTIAMLGRAGTLAAGCWFFRKHHRALPKLAGGFAAIALYEWQKEGKISGLASDD